MKTMRILHLRWFQMPSTRSLAALRVGLHAAVVDTAEGQRESFLQGG